KSTDGGGNWGPPMPFYSVPGAYVASLAINPDLSDTLYVTVGYGPSAGIFKSVDGGASWLPSPIETDAVALAIDPLDSNTIYAGTWSHGVLKTTDAGSSWMPAASGFRQTRVLTLAADAQDIGVLYASTQIGIFKTEDQGIHWRKADSGLPSDAPPDIRSL